MSHRTSSLAWLLCCLSVILPAVGTQSLPVTESKSAEIVAEVSKEAITRGEFESNRAQELFQPQNAHYQAERKILNEYISQRLLERQARKEGLSIGELLRRHVESTLPKDPPDDALRVYYEGLDLRQPFETVRAQIVTHLRQKRLERAKAAYMETLRDRAHIAVTLPAPRVAFSLENMPVRGSSGAPVTMVEFADYECPYCQKAYPVVKKLQEEYKDKLAFVYIETPLVMHAHAQKASEAASCAGVQGKYWEYHDLLFASKRLDLTDLKEHARKLNLDGNAFDRCLTSSEQAETVKSQAAEFARLGLEGTPSFFINGRFVDGAADYATLHSMVEQELAGDKARGGSH